MKKTVLLAIIFIVPIVGVLIFNFFSKSHFNIPVYYQDDVSQRPGCPEITSPYSINNNQLALLDSQNVFEEYTVKIVSLEDNSENYITQLNRIADAYYEVEGAQIISLTSFDTTKTSIPLAGNISEIVIEEQDISKVKNCVFLFEEEKNNNAVLVDFENRIRGYYNLKMKEQADSLIIEGKILIREKEL